MPVNEFALFVPGPPTGASRARATSRGGHVRMYAPEKNRRWENLLIQYWREEGEPTIVNSSLDFYEIDLLLVCRRPKNHFRTDGISLNAIGERAVRPARKPDLDNALKLTLDALVTVAATTDDARCVRAVTEKVWETRRLAEGTYLNVRRSNNQPNPKHLQGRKAKR